MVNKTLNYYNQNADSFIEGTVSVNFKEVQDKFLQMLSGKKILDFGCGSGRDTMYFLKSGFDVTATDGSEELCKYASEYTGILLRDRYESLKVGFLILLKLESRFIIRSA